MANTITVAKTSHKQKRHAKDYAVGTILRGSEGSENLWMVVATYGGEHALANLTTGYLGESNPFIFGEVLVEGAEITITVGA